MTFWPSSRAGAFCEQLAVGPCPSLFGSLGAVQRRLGPGPGQSAVAAMTDSAYVTAATQEPPGAARIPEGVTVLPGEYRDLPESGVAGAEF